MARARKVSDEAVFEVVLQLLAARGEKAVTFAAVAERAGLAASSLAERYGSVAGLISGSREAAWQRLEAATDQAVSRAGRDPEGAVQLLKALRAVALPAPQTQPQRAALWRARLEAELALRLGGGARGRQAAGILFSVWHSQRTWAGPAGGRLRLKEVLRRLGVEGA